MPSCPECDAEIEVDALDEFDVDLDDRLTCSACGARLEVVDLEPIELAPESANDGHDEREEHDESDDKDPDAPSVGDEDEDEDPDDDNGLAG